MKTIEQHFTDWEGNTFGFGYGTGEEHTLDALKRFLAAIPANGAYNFQTLEHAVTPVVAWLLINTLAHAHLIDYGTSPRFGWLDPRGKVLKAFVDARTVSDLYELTSHDEDYIPCYPDHCNCDGSSDKQGCVVENPFWCEKAAAQS